MLGIGSVIKMVAILVIVLIVAGGIYYISNLQAALAVSQLNEKTLEKAITDQQEVIAGMKADIETIQATNEQLRKENEQQRKDVNALSKKFDKRDFGVFAIANTEKTQELVDRGVKNALRCIEIASGAPLTEEEKNAPSPIEANRECPALINPNFTAAN